MALAFRIAFKLMPFITKSIKEFVKGFKAAKAKDSDGGTKITSNEFNKIVSYFGAALFAEMPSMLEVVLEELGYEVDLDGDGE